MDEYVCLLGCFLGLRIITRITVVSGTKWMFLPQLHFELAKGWSPEKFGGWFETRLIFFRFFGGIVGTC
jgi:hypothetical protein